MHEIICPHCHKAFKIDEAGYADILKQVRDGDFEKQLHERLELAEREKRDAIALAEAKATLRWRPSLKSCRGPSHFLSCILKNTPQNLRRIR